LSVTDGIGLLFPSNAWPVRFTVCPTCRFADVGFTDTDATVGETVVGSVPVLFPEVASPPPLTVTLFVTLAATLLAKFTVNVIAGYAALPARTLLVVQVLVANVQLQPVPLIAVAVKPAGSVSTTVTVPDVDAVPTFDTVSV
jgi:hypothetical protein